MPTNFYRLESETHAPEGSQPLSDRPPRVFPADNPVLFTPDARIFGVDGLNQKEEIDVSSDGLLPMTCLMLFREYRSW